MAAFFDIVAELSWTARVVAFVLVVGAAWLLVVLAEDSNWTREQRVMARRLGDLSTLPVCATPRAVDTTTWVLVHDQRDRVSLKLPSSFVQNATSEPATDGVLRLADGNRELALGWDAGQDSLPLRSTANACQMNVAGQEAVIWERVGPSGSTLTLAWPNARHVALYATFRGENDLPVLWTAIQTVRFDSAGR